MDIRPQKFQIMITYRLYPSLRNDKKKADGSCPIYWYLRVGATTIKMPTGKSVMPNEWNKKENTAKSNSAKGMALASFLSKKITEFNTFALSEEAMGKTITLTLAQSFFNNSNKADFYEFWMSEIELWQSSKKYNTLKGYLTTYRILKEIAPKLSFGDLNLCFLEKFDNHMATVRKNCANGRFTKHKALRCMIRRAMVKKLIKENPYQQFTLKPAKGQRVFLTPEEVQKIRAYQIESNGRNIFHAKDFLLFSIFTGLRFSDIVGLKFGNIKSDHLELTMEKTSKPIIIPLLPMAKQIIAKYQTKAIIFDEKLVFPQVANSVINKKLKELMILIGIKKSVSMHVGRHTFASLHVHAKTSLVHLQQLLGHANIADTMIYAKVMKEDLFTSMENLNAIYKHQEAI